MPEFCDEPQLIRDEQRDRKGNVLFSFPLFALHGTSPDNQTVSLPVHAATALKSVCSCCCQFWQFGSRILWRKQCCGTYHRISPCSSRWCFCSLASFISRRVMLGF